VVSVDVLVRIIAEQLKNKFGQPFVVENRPGAAAIWDRRRHR